MDLTNFKYQVIHTNDRNISYKIENGNQVYYLKKSKSDYLVSNEINAQRLFKITSPNLVPIFYATDDQTILLVEWLNDYKWIEYDKIRTEQILSIVEFIKQNTIKNLYNVLNENLTKYEILHFLEVKKKLISMHVSAYKSLIKYIKNAGYCLDINQYKLLLDDFVNENNVLIHGDLNRSNILSDGYKIKIIDYEYATFSSSEYEVGRLAAAFIIQGLEEFRKYQKINQSLKNIINTLIKIFDGLKNYIDIDKAISYTGFYMVYIVFYHYNNFTNIKNRDEYSKYFLPFALTLIKDGINANFNEIKSKNFFLKILLKMLKENNQ